MRNVFLAICVLGFIFIASCTDSSEKVQLFEALSADSSGVDFTNSLEYSEQLNPYTFKNFYNGGGVAIGDINNDGLSDLFFSGNMVSNRIYLNNGGLKFEDITSRSNLESVDVWTTGASMVDINADGFLLDFELFNLLAGHAATALFASKLYSESERKLSTIQGFLDLLKQ